VRVAVAVLWIGNSEWKVPTHFSGLRDFVQRGVAAPVFSPLDWVLRHIVLKQMTLFGFTTLIVETSLGALLLIGWKTRWVALIGAAQALVIGLTVADVKGEWPWSYWLLVAVHLLLFATDAGRHGGIDGMIGGARSRRRLTLVIGATAVVIGAWTGITAAGDGKTLELIKEVKLFRSTLAGGLVLVALGLLVLGSVLWKRSVLLLGAGAVALVLALVTYVRWRDDGTYPIGLGYDGKAIAVLLALAVSSALLGRAPVSSD
jgi:uncharacterized membrane protein YphA (DoxX/SURF4 family)